MKRLATLALLFLLWCVLAPIVGCAALGDLFRRPNREDSPDR